MTLFRKTLGAVGLFLLTIVMGRSEVEMKVDWPEFMTRHDMIWEQLPDRWEESPYLANGNVGAMFYKDGEANRIRLQLFRIDVQDHRDNTHGWSAYSRPRLMIGSFYLEPVGEITGGEWRFDIWNAELTGKIVTDRGEIAFQQMVPQHSMIVHTRLEGSDGETGAKWVWEPGVARTTRDGYPETKAEREKFIELYGEIYRDALKPYEPNPPVKLLREQGVHLSTQDLNAGGQYAVAWQETDEHLVVSIEKSYPATTAARDAVTAVKTVQKNYGEDWIGQHRNWWHNYYRQSFLSLPDTRLESLYWHQIYKLACATRKDGPMMDTAGPWIQPTPWPYITWDLNVQLCYWPAGPANRMEVAETLVHHLHKYRQNLIENVRPVEWQADSAYIPVATAQDLIGRRDEDQRYSDCVGNLCWAMHNCFLIYKYSMDDELLREKIYPLLKRCINLYRHLMIENEDGTIELPVTYSPEVGSARNTNYDLGLFRWGVQTLLWSAERLEIDDPLIPEWRRIDKKLLNFPVDENGYRTGSDRPWNSSHRHYSHLLQAYPLYLVNREQGAEVELLIRKSLEHWISYKGALQGYSFTGASSIAASLGDGDAALDYLKGLERYLQPNGLYKEAGPVMETPLSAAQSIHDMMMQSWGDKIRVFPAAPSAWGDIAFHNMRAEGAFLVSARRKGGKTDWIRIQSLAGEPCVVANPFGEAVQVQVSGSGRFKLKGNEIHIALAAGEEVEICRSAETALIIDAIPADGDVQSFGLRK